MRNPEIIEYKRRLDALFKALPTDADDLLRSHWARYLCVRVSGFIEVSLAAILNEFAQNAAAPQVSNYVGAQLAWVQNCKMDRILAVIRDFSPAWAATIETGSDGRIKDAIDSVVNVRHKVAHGENTGISYVTIKQYYDAVLDGIQLLEDTINPPPVR